MWVAHAALKDQNCVEERKSDRLTFIFFFVQKCVG